MKRTFSIGLALVLLISFASCQKWEGGKEKKGDYYYSHDYKEAEGTVLDIDVNDITKLYSVFFYEGKTLKYKLVVHDNSEETNNSTCPFGKCDDKDSYAAYEEGRAEVDDELNIIFIPDANPSGTYNAYFENEKKNYKVTLPGIELRELNFVAK